MPFLVTFVSDGEPRMLFKKRNNAVKYCKKHNDSTWEEWDYFD